MDHFFNGLERVTDRINSFFILIGAIMLVGLMILVNTDLFLRFFFKSPVLGITEVTEIFLLYITFLGAAWVFRDDGHVVVDVLLYNLMPGSRKVFEVQNNIIVGIISFVLVYYGTLTTIDHFMRGARNPTILETPIALVTGVIPVGAAVLLLEVLIKLRKLLAKGG
jgi:C4-dicarboxylate transporter, DctQ subunit